MNGLITSTHVMTVCALSIALCACATSTTPGPSAVQSPTPLSTAQVHPTATARQAPATGTPLVTLTAMPSPTQRVVPSPTLPEATATATPYPTYTAQEAQQMGSSLLITNAGCLLPCWWGIQPGISHQQDAENLVQRWSYHGSSLQHTRMGLFVPDVNSPSGYHIDVTFVLSHEIISSIKVDMEVNNYNQKHSYSVRDWHALIWDRILSTYGVPDQVTFSPGELPPERDAPMLYALIFIYKSKGFVISYMGPSTYDSRTQKAVACPTSGEVIRIRLNLAPTGDVNTLRDILKGKGLEIDQPVGPKSSTLDPQTFYERMKGTTAGVCFDASGLLPAK